MSWPEIDEFDELEMSVDFEEVTEKLGVDNAEEIVEATAGRPLSRRAMSLDVGESVQVSVEIEKESEEYGFVFRYDE